MGIVLLERKRYLSRFDTIEKKLCVYLIFSAEYCGKPLSRALRRSCPPSHDSHTQDSREERAITRGIPKNRSSPSAIDDRQLRRKSAALTPGGDGLRDFPRVVASTNRRIPALSCCPAVFPIPNQPQNLTPKDNTREPNLSIAIRVEHLEQSVGRPKIATRRIAPEER